MALTTTLHSTAKIRGFFFPSYLIPSSPTIVTPQSEHKLNQISDNIT